MNPQPKWPIPFKNTGGKMQEQQCFPLCLSCSVRKGRWKDSILQHNLYFSINIKRNMNPEGLQASTAKWQAPVKVNVHFHFSQVLTADYLPSLSLLNSKHLSIEPGQFQCTLFIYLSFRQTGKYLFHLLKILEFQIYTSGSKKGKAPTGMHLRLELLPIQWHQSFYCWRG